MPKRARDVMTPDPACCSPHTSIDQVAKMMIQNNCGEIPIVDAANRPLGVVTDRDIVCRIVAEGKNPLGYTEQAMTTPAVALGPDVSIDDVIETMEDHQIRRVLVVDDGGACAGIIAQADVAAKGSARKAAELLREVSREERERSH